MVRISQSNNCMRLIFLIFLLISAPLLLAQTSNKKAQKCFDDAFNQFNLGNKPKALSLLKSATKKDPAFADAYSLEALIYESMKDSANALAAHRKAIKADPFYQTSWYSYARYLFSLERYADALKAIEAFEKLPLINGFDQKKDAARKSVVEDAARLKESCVMGIRDSKNIEELNVRNMGPNINTADYEYWPGMTINGKIFIFTRMLNSQEDFYISEWKDTAWAKAIPLPGKINTPENEGTTSINPDGRYIFYTVCNQDGYGSCDLFYSVYDAETNGWSKRRNMGPVINSRHWDAQPSISADGRTLIFASSRPGGYGGKDLWMSKLVGNKWTEPVNLGPTINTSMDDEAPFFHYDGATLYFSSNGHAGYGGHDLFVSRRNPDGSWTKPINMGKGINTSSDEIGIYADRKGEKAYFVSTREGGYGGPDIYSFNLLGEKKPKPVSYVTGKVFDEETGKEITGKIQIINLQTGELLLTDSSDYFFMSLPQGGNYALNVNRQGYLFYSANFQPEQATIDQPYAVNAYLRKIKSDVSIVLENIFFDVDKFDLKSESFSELDVVSNLLKNNPKIRIEISGHTDNSGSAEHNKTLSLNRAKSVQDYLISKGTKPDRLSIKGFGSEKPVATNDTLEGKAKNRRIEMKILSVESKN